ncbi:MAG: hypothetical protein ACI4ET_03960 [Bilifractor sp.]
MKRRMQLLAAVLTAVTVLTASVPVMGEEQTPANVGTVSAELNETTEASDDQKTESVDVSYRTHVQNDGTQDWVHNGGISGTTGQSKRLEGIWIQASATDKDQQKHDIPLVYQTHVQNYGWQDWKNSGEMAGTEGQSLRLEAIRINFGDDACKAKYDIYYRVHAQNFGWLHWAKNGESAGTEGYAYRLEAIQVLILPKGSAAPSASYGGIVSQSSAAFDKKVVLPTISYRTHVQNVGWQPYVTDGTISGTVGKSLRLEAINLSVGSNPYKSGGITYSTHVQNYGWQDWKSDGELSGTEGKSLRLEAIKIALTGDLANYYDVYYRSHAQNFGWLAWVKDGEPSGTAGYSYRLEGIQVVLVKKDAAPPADNDFKGASEQSSYGFVNKDGSKGHYETVTVVDKPAWDETVIDKDAWDETVVDTPAWDETIVDKQAYDEQVVDQPAWDETTYKTEEHNICYVCGQDYHGWTQDQVDADQEKHMLAGEGGGYGSRSVKVPITVHHDATYKTVHHDAVTHVVHHDAVTHVVHHDAETHVVHHDAVTHTEKKWVDET